MIIVFIYINYNNQYAQILQNEKYSKKNCELKLNKIQNGLQDICTEIQSVPLPKKKLQ